MKRELYRIISLIMVMVCLFNVSLCWVDASFAAEVETARVTSDDVYDYMASKLLEEHEYIINIKKEEPFWKRHLGKIIGATAASIILVGGAVVIIASGGTAAPTAPAMISAASALAAKTACIAGGVVASHSLAAVVVGTTVFVVAGRTLYLTFTQSETAESLEELFDRVSLRKLRKVDVPGILRAELASQKPTILSIADTNEEMLTLINQAAARTLQKITLQYE